MKHFEATIQEIIEKKKDCPLPIGIIPDQMGINLCSVHKIVWTEQDDTQIVSLTILFNPARSVDCDELYPETYYAVEDIGSDVA